MPTGAFAARRGKKRFAMTQSSVVAKRLCGSVPLWFVLLFQSLKLAEDELVGSVGAVGDAEDFSGFDDSVGKTEGK